MGIEIERKFLLVGEAWKKLAQGVRYRQGYLSTSKESTVRVRTIENTGYLTVKGKSTGATRSEFEYEIPVEDANTMLDQLCAKPLIEKKRYKIEYEGFTWEVDEFFGENQGLVVAEIELESEDQPYTKPEWVGAEVTQDQRYFNSNLARNPYCRWE
ncbi:CYTH domain-containing protein [Desulfogranum marinum]|uniref:CYTH domain-containing protein n=1 Tax=Desulfogranum marinum TaxID=453220 RepID=UPI001962A878|nr:CYTH domain-containing protein [Desulfogranum marinum]MBM9511781.1 CYTH domain-containing protein [Desulfogranum marinum]